MAKITIDIKRSKILAILLFIIHFSAIASCWLLFNGYFIKSFLLIGCLFSFITAHSRYAWLLSANSIVKLWWEDNIWCLQKKSGSILVAALCNDSYITPSFMLLNFTVGLRRSVRVPIFAGALNENDLRHFRVMLLTQ